MAAERLLSDGAEEAIASSSAIPLDGWQLGAAGLFVVTAALISMLLRLGLVKSLAVAAFRTTLQLLVVGYVLTYVFEFTSPWPVLATALFMIAAAAQASLQRLERRYRGAGRDALVTLLISALLTSVLVTHGVVQVEPFYRPQYFIPLLGMILGNGLSGISLGVGAFLESLSDKADEVEAELALGATRWEAAQGPFGRAVRRGMVPILNAMTAAGIVSLPGMMTGQILQGASPIAAVQYQVVVMFMLAFATLLGCVLACLFAYRHVFDDAHRLRRERIVASR